MKISSDPGMVAALQTWQTLQPATIEGASADSVSGPSNSSATAARDGAEGLLELDVWNGAPPQSRQLVATASFQPRGAEPASIVQAWADHIFQPLV